MRGTMHHIDFTVNDARVSAQLYGAVLTFMGYQQRQEFEWRLTTPLGHTSIALNPAKGEHAIHPHDRYSPGLHHFAWRAANREDVDRLHDLLNEIGAEILRRPTTRNTTAGAATMPCSLPTATG